MSNKIKIKLPVCIKIINWKKVREKEIETKLNQREKKIYKPHSNYYKNSI